MVKATWLGVALGALLIASGLIATVAIIFTSADDDADDSIDKPIRWSIKSHDMESAPPRPLFQSNDNAECKRVINEHFEMASGSFEYAVKNNAKLIGSYQDILDQ